MDHIALRKKDRRKQHCVYAPGVLCAEFSLFRVVAKRLKDLKTTRRVSVLEKCL